MQNLRINFGIIEIKDSIIEIKDYSHLSYLLNPDKYLELKKFDNIKPYSGGDYFKNMDILFPAEMIKIIYSEIPYQRLTQYCVNKYPEDYKSFIPVLKEIDKEIINVKHWFKKDEKKQVIKFSFNYYSELFLLQNPDMEKSYFGKFQYRIEDMKNVKL